MHYMDPRNFLDEKHIFQFESTAYNAKQTKAGVETILSPTWMHNSLINYLTTDGKTRKNYRQQDQVFDRDFGRRKKQRYERLLSGLQNRTGGWRTKATTGGASGNRAPFIGLQLLQYRRLQRRMDGLEWAAGYLRLEKDATIYSDYKNGKVSGTQDQG